ncbi:MAG: hypothetical protein Q4F83_03255 [Eubacteriales bacterium]|nr:hypothetical protein [Eubacteriales bacterium]
MKWYRKLYLGEGMKKSRKELIKKLETNAGLPGVYVITLASNGRDLFDIFSANQLLQPVLHGLCPPIIGLSSGYEEAMELSKDIALAAYRTNGNFDIPAYLQGQMENGEEWIYEYPVQKLKKRKKFLFRK